ncbi:UNVERIFIED_CONTAM: hypothetical protein NCL1_25493 [Trichonephila clavipes]
MEFNIPLYTSEAHNSFENIYVKNRPRNWIASSRETPYFRSIKRKRKYISIHMQRSVSRCFEIDTKIESRST